MFNNLQMFFLRILFNVNRICLYLDVTWFVIECYQARCICCDEIRYATHVELQFGNGFAIITCGFNNTAGSFDNLVMNSRTRRVANNSMSTWIAANMSPIIVPVTIEYKLLIILGIFSYQDCVSFV